MTIKEIRKKLNMSQSEFANYLEIPIVNIQHWEQGVSNPPEYVLRLINRLLKAEILDIMPGGTRKVKFTYEGIFNEIIERNCCYEDN